MKFLAIAFLVVSSLPSILMADQLPIYGQETKFEALKNAYESSPAAASLSNFENYNANEKLRTYDCVMVEEKNSNNLIPLLVGIMTQKIAGTPANGPLFPGSPDQIEKKVIVGDTNVFDHITTTYPVFLNYITNTDFVVRVLKNSLNIYADIGDQINIIFRKTDNYLPFKVEKNLDGNGPLFPSEKGTPLYYGYCYKK